MLSLIFNAQFLESRNFTAARSCETLLASPPTGILGFFHVFHYRPSRVWILEYVVTGNGSGCDLFSHKFHKTCLEVVELCQPTAKELWKLLVFILVVLGQAVITLGVRLSTSALRRCHCPPALAAQAQEPCEHGRRLASSRACCVVHRHRYPTRRCQCQCLRQLHLSSPKQLFRVLKTPRHMSGTQSDRTTAVSQCCACGESRSFFLQRPAASRPHPHGAREVTPTHFAVASSGEQP